MDGFIIDPTQYVITRWVFLRVLGLVYLIAFASFGFQVSGLIGVQGILPAGRFLAAVRETLGRKGYLIYPTLAWLNSSDTSLKLICVSGAVLAVLLIAGLQTTLVLALLWILYLSLVSVGQVFLAFQWDALLLETGFLSIFLVQPSLLPSQAAAPPSPLVIWLFRWLLFRLMLMSGLKKLASGDRTWRDLTALEYHYETQPLPTPLAYYMHRLPPAFQKLSTLFSLIVELPVPFLFFASRAFRFTGAWLTILLQVLILLTGNYTFFNYLTIGLTVFLFDDTAFRLILPSSVLQFAASATPAGPAQWWTFALVPLAVVLVVAGGLYILMLVVRLPAFVAFLDPVLDVVGRLRIVNPYGLFTVMTTERPEILVEGSDDAEVWIPYEFKYKPGNRKRPPPVVAPHQPRLDWQMWFAALGGQVRDTWFVRFVERLLLGTPEVTRLLARNPFPDKPPKYIRAVLYDYRFTTAEERANTGEWWHREELGPFLRPVSLTKRTTQDVPR